MITPTICQLAVAMAGTSLVLQLASAVAHDRRPAEDASTVPVGAAPSSAPGLSPITGLPTRPITSGREWSRSNLAKLCRHHKVHSAEWRAYAKKGAMASALISMGVTHG